MNNFDEALFFSFPHPMWIHDLETFRIVEVNAAALSTYGFTREEFLGMKLRELLYQNENEMLNRSEDTVSKEFARFATSKHRKKDGTLIFVECTAHAISWKGKHAEIVCAHDVTERFKMELRLERINQVLLSMSTDYQANIDRLTALCGELLGAACALYNRLRGGMLCSLGAWNTPEDYDTVDTPDGHICYDVLHRPETDVMVVRHLQESHYAETDPNVRRYNLHTYLGKAVRANNEAVGSLCVVYQHDFIPTQDDRRTIGIIAAAIGTEENRMLAEANLKEREEKYRILFDVESDALFLIDNEEGRLLEANRAAAQMYGYSHEELLCMKNTDLSAEPYQTQVVTRTNPPDPGTVINVPLRWHRRKDGTVFPVEITGRFFLQNGRGVHIAAIRDISHRQAAERALRDSEQNYRTIFNSTNEAIFIQDPITGGILDVNTSMLRMFGYYSKEEVLKKSIGELSANVAPFTQVEVMDNVRKTLSVGPQIFEWQARRSTGEIFWVEVSLRATVLSGKECILAVVRDVNERKRLEEDLLQSQKMESVGRLAGGVAHDFNNMLMVILGRCELALAHLPLDAPMRSDFLEIQHVARRSAQLTQQLLAFARKQMIQPKIVQVNDVVEGMLRMLQRLIGEDITLRWVPAPNLWQVKLDPVQVDQILANLLLNARDAINGSGTIRIETKNICINHALSAEHADIQSGEYVLLTVSDTGVGMTPDVKKHLFDPFYTTKQIGKGTGLGLATVYGIIKQNNGYIEVDSVPGKGTTFFMYFPRYLVSPSEIHSTVRESIIPTGAETILVVEDDIAILNILKEHLLRLGYRVLTHHSPVAALTEYGSGVQHLDLLITDVIMPEMNGKQLYEKMREIRPALKCLYVSGYTSDIIAERGMLDENCPFAQKPFQIADLSEKIRAVLDGKINAS